jgi:hypothetical protein
LLRGLLGAPGDLGVAYLTGLPPCGISTTTLMSRGGERPTAILLTSIGHPFGLKHQDRQRGRVVHHRGEKSA